MKQNYKLKDVVFGAVVFKNTEFDDKGKSFFMKVANWVTSKIQSIKKKKKNKSILHETDHTEILTVNQGIVETHSSVSGTGFRTQLLLNWAEREGNPEVLILHPPKPFSEHEKRSILQEISFLRGVPYALKIAVEAGITEKEFEDVNELALLRIRGIFCSESTKKLSRFGNWAGVWPDELLDFLLQRGYTVEYKGEIKNIF